MIRRAGRLAISPLDRMMIWAPGRDMKSLLIAGCGDLGTRWPIAWILPIGASLDCDATPVELPRRIQGVAGDLTRPETLRKLDRHY